MVEKLTYRVAEAVEATGLSRGLIYRDTANGTLRSVRVGRTVLIPAAALRDYLSLPREAEQQPEPKEVADAPA